MAKISKAVYSSLINIIDKAFIFHNLHDETNEEVIICFIQAQVFMKKKIFIAAAIIVIIVVSLLNFRPGKTDPRFVSMKDHAFSIHEKPFYPITINYIAALGTNSKDYWPSPLPEYGPEGVTTYFSKDSSLAILKSDFETIKQMGFNTIRFTHIGEVNVEDSANGLVYIKSYNKDVADTKIVFTDDKILSKYLIALDELFDLAGQAGLKVIFLVKVHEEFEPSKDHFKKVMSHFENDTTIMAYDLFNEPLYFEKTRREKRAIHNISQDWHKMVKKYAPNQLCTIGLTGIREVFEWDPNILDLDFLSFHPYEYEPNQVLNEVYWYGKYITKPWIIGETSFPANNDSIKYEEQNKFAEKTLKQVCDCGGIGYSWWQYKDVKWGKFHSDFMGIVNWKGTTINEKGHTIFGTIKPLEKVFQSYFPKPNAKDCFKYENYYNYSGYKEYRVQGTIVDNSDRPIVGAVVMGWIDDWSKAVHTVTKKDGTFELYSNFAFGHWIASATNYSTLRENFWDPSQMHIAADSVKTYELGKLKLKKLILF